MCIGEIREIKAGNFTVAIKNTVLKFKIIISGDYLIIKSGYLFLI